MNFPNTTQQQLFSIPKTRTVHVGDHKRILLCLSVLHPLTWRNYFHQQQSEQFMKTTSMWTLFCVILAPFVDLSHGIVDAWDQEECFFIPVCDYIYTHCSSPGPQFWLKWIVPPFTVSFASSRWRLPSEPGTHYSPFLKQTLQSDASSRTWGFHSWKPL